jgi:tetratricopeptide (TPR) repeat protein
MLAFQARSSGDYDRAIALAEESLAIARQIRVGDSTSWAIGSLSQFYRLKGDFDRARVLADETARRQPDERMPVYQLGLIEMGAGDWKRAEEYFQYGLDRRLGQPHWDWWRLLLSWVARQQGNPDRAHRLLEEDVVVARQEGARERIPWILFDLAELDRSLNNPAVGRSRVAEGLELALRDGNHQRLAHGLLVGACWAADGDDRIRAVRLFGAADAALPGFRFEDDAFPLERYERVIDDLRAALSSDAFATAWAEGQAMAVEEAIALALEENGDITPGR